MPCNYKDYPPNWKEIVARLKKKRGDRCELCFAQNGMKVGRPIKGHISEHPWYSSVLSHVVHLFRTTKIIITTHHIDSNKKNSDDNNLILLCQRCHLRLDMRKHVANRRKKAVKEMYSRIVRRLHETNIY